MPWRTLLPAVTGMLLLPASLDLPGWGIGDRFGVQAPVETASMAPGLSLMLIGCGLSFLCGMGVMYWARKAARARAPGHSLENRLKRLLDSNLVGVFIMDPRRRVVDANEAFYAMMGYSREDVRDRTVDWGRLVSAEPPEEGRAPGQRPQAGFPASYEKLCVRKDGRKVWSLMAEVALDGDEGIAAFMMDIDARKQAEESLRRSEEQARQSQKMEAIGRLAGGVAHDFNNLLTAINGYSEILLNALEPGSPHHSAVEEIRKSGERAVALTAQMLTFSRKQMVVPKVLDANPVVADAAALLRKLLGGNIELDVALDPRAGRIRADASLVQQVIVNLGMNGRDAMPNGGRLKIATSPSEIGEGVQPAEGGRGFQLMAPPGSYMALTVGDSGSGMDDSALTHLFEPYFSTKEKGKGAGLGLSTVYGIVKQFNGGIRVDSRRGEGTAITVYLPRVDSEANPGKAETVRETSALRGEEKILLVEDEESVRGFARKILEGKGYSVVTAEDGYEAIRRFHEHGGEISLLLTDVIMPGMNGRELADLIRGMKPGIRVVFISGYTDDEAFRRDVVDEGMAFQPKPFSPEDLLHIVREALDAPAPQPRR
jgi:PAS domain S-box-containing protein